MESTESILFIALAVMNLAAGFGCAIPFAQLLGKVNGRQKRFFRYFVILIGIYFLECVAFPVGMATQVFTVGLAFVWGIIFGLWLRSRAPAREVLKTALFLSFYTCFPTASFCILLPVIRLIEEGNILSATEGIGFGIPDFFPWPLNTILGFCLALIIGTVVFKTVITTGEVSLLIHLGEQSAVGSSKMA